MTIYPGWYPGRTVHIHFKIRKSGKELLTTQCYVEGHPNNARDGIYRSLKDPKARDSVTIDFAPIAQTPTKEPENA